jgi:uncharacterized RDD family membrane protein YckC
MLCQNCDAPIPPSETKCQRCGAKLLPQRVMFGAKPKEFSLTPDEDTWEVGEGNFLQERWPAAIDGNNGTQEHIAADDEPATEYFRWGGFLRRVFAFVVDLVVICIISIVLFFVCFIGYKVGLAAHDKAITPDNSAGLVNFLAWSWTFLVTSYFVVLHGMDGQTVGKWLLGLRLIDKRGERLTYSRVALRWLAGLVLAPLVISWLWIIWSREKRAWHDYLARTWVVRV